MLEDGLGFDHIVNVMLKVVNAMVEKMADNWETDYEGEIVDQLVLHSNCFPVALGSDVQCQGDQDLDVDEVGRVEPVVEVLTDDHDGSGDVAHQHD